MTHAKNVWLVIMLETLHTHMLWSREDVIDYIYPDIVRLYMR